RYAQLRSIAIPMAAARGWRSTWRRQSVCWRGKGLPGGSAGFRSRPPRRGGWWRGGGRLVAAGWVGFSRVAVRRAKAARAPGGRCVAQGIAAQAGVNDQVIVIDENWRLPPGMEWYLRQSGVKVFWNGQLDPRLLATSTQRVWIFLFCAAPQRLARL